MPIYVIMKEAEAGSPRLGSFTAFCSMEAAKEALQYAYGELEEFAPGCYQDDDHTRYYIFELLLED